MPTDVAAALKQRGINPRKSAGSNRRLCQTDSDEDHVLTRPAMRIDQDTKVLLHRESIPT